MATGLQLAEKEKEKQRSACTTTHAGITHNPGEGGYQPTKDDGGEEEDIGNMKER